MLTLTALAVPALSSGGAPPTSPGYKGAPAAPKELPQKPQEIRVLAKQYEFIPNRIAVKLNVPVRLIITSADVYHGFAIDDFKIDATIEKGKETIITFTPKKTGTYVFYCSIFCGVGHRDMRGLLIVE